MVRPLVKSCTYLISSADHARLRSLRPAYPSPTHATCRCEGAAARCAPRRAGTVAPAAQYYLQPAQPAGVLSGASSATGLFLLSAPAPANALCVLHRQGVLRVYFACKPLPGRVPLPLANPWQNVYESHTQSVCDGL